MPGKSGNLGQFWQELKRRKVVRVITVYAAASFVILELVSIITEPLKLPEWTLALIFVLLCVGFIIAVILSWIYDITPEGIEKTKPARVVKEKATERPSQIVTWKIATIIGIVIIVALVGFNIFTGRNQSRDIANLEKSIAVLPFDNMSPGEENSHLGDAISDEIILELHKIKEFRVLSRSSTMQYKENRPTIPEMADKLGVSYLIEGGIQRFNEDVSIRVQVIRAINEDHIWGDEYDGKWNDIQSIQDEIALRVAEELKIVLSPNEIGQIEKKQTENPEAYNLYLRGRYFWENRTVESLFKAIEYFTQAVKLDSNYALAHIGIADSYSLLAYYDDKIEYLSKAKPAALKALKINKDLAEANTTMGYINFIEWNYDSAEKYYLKAIENDPEYATAHHWYALLLMSKGKTSQAIDKILTARDLDPLSLVINRSVGIIYIDANQYDNAIEALNKVRKINPEFPNLQFNLARAYFFKGMYDSALSVIQNTNNITWQGIIYAQMGQLDKANQLLDELVLLSQTKPSLQSDLAMLNFALGLNEKGFDHLEKAYEIHDLSLTNIRRYPELDEISTDQRFIDILEKMGLND